ncbi:hypothetical protein VNO80_06180 [Phaseolus coccineus]|uniref:Uncharacterized protein n=1 Tax=Phaseolus coccineus TaxID=3886 RepID=A0AAN9NH97_PHACN
MSSMSAPPLMEAVEEVPLSREGGSPVPTLCVVLPWPTLVAAPRLLQAGRRPKDSVEVDEIAEDGLETTTTVRRLRDLWESGEFTVRPRWRSNGGLGPIQYGTNSESRLSFCSNAESDCDIIKCNNRIRLEEMVDESARLWDLAKQLGMKCLGDEAEVVSEMERLEERDNEVKKMFEEGTTNGAL